MGAPGRGPGWRLVVGVLAYAIWAPLSLVTLPCAALLATTRDQSARTRVMAAALAVVSAALLVAPGGGRLGAVTRAFTVLVTVAFVAGVLVSPPPPPHAAAAAFVRQALRAIVVAGTATAVLVQVVWGAGAWGALAWEARRDAGLAMRIVVEFWPAALVLYEPVVRFVTMATPFTLALKALLGLALARQWHRSLTADGSFHAPEGGEAAIHEGLVTSTN